MSQTRDMTFISDIKVETETSLCHGCLSGDRTLETLRDNIDLFFYLLERQYESLQFIDILLCWECMALLRRILAFQRRIQSAQAILNDYSGRLKDKPATLSTLLTAQIIETKVAIKAELVSPNYCNDFSDDDVSNVVDKFDVDDDGIQHIVYSGLDGYCENDAEGSWKNENDHAKREDENIVIEDTVKAKTKGIKHKKSKKKSRVRACDPIMTKNNFDPNNMEQHYSVVHVSVNEIDAIVNKMNSKHYQKGARYKCKLCRNGYKRLIDLNRHVNFKHTVGKQKEGPYECSECTEVFPTVPILESHWQNHNAVYKCGMCAALRLRRADMNGHVKEHAHAYTCRTCGEKFYMRRQFKTHYKAVHRMATLCCDHCGNKFKTKLKIEKHMIMVHLPPKCRECNISFAEYNYLYRHNLATHVRTNGPELSYCVECDKQFATVHKYKSHLRGAASHTPRKKLSIPCPECDKTFTRKCYLNNHYRLFHLKRSNHYCDICDKYFANSYGVRLHRERVHEGIKPPKDKICETCGMAFSTSTALRRHVRTHTGERPHACPRCPAAFAQRTPLKSHLRTQHKVY